MSDLTFASPQNNIPEERSTVKESKTKTNGWVSLFVVVLVVALLSEAGYFFYNRYISNQKVGNLKNLSTDETMNYDAQSAPPVAVNETVGTIISHTGDLSRQKAIDALDNMESFPKEYVFKSSINVGIQGKVVAVLDEMNEGDGVTYVARLKLVNTKGDPKSLLFSDDEIERMRVIKVDKGVIQKEVEYHDIKPGDYVNILISSDLFDLRHGADEITIEIRTY